MRRPPHNLSSVGTGVEVGTGFESTVGASEMFVGVFGSKGVGVPASKGDEAVTVVLVTKSSVEVGAGFESTVGVSEMFVGIFGSKGVGVPASKGDVAVTVVSVTKSSVRVDFILETDCVVGVIVSVPDGLIFVTDVEGVTTLGCVVESSGGGVGSDMHVCISLCSVNRSTHEQA